MSKTTLTPKQRRFVEEYCVDWNATQAAIRAGYSEKTAYSQGQRLLKNVEIREAIAREQDRLSERTRISRERIMKELARTGFADMRNFAEWSSEGVRFRDSDELSSDDSPAVKEVSSERRLITNKDGDIIGETVTLSMKLHDKKGALELMGKHLGMWTENINLSGERPFVVRLKGLPGSEDEAGEDEA
jgi:phage terminase small subunit